MEIILIDEDTVKEVRETIIDLRVLKQRIADIETEIIETQKQADMVYNDFKFERINLLEREKKEILGQLTNYGVTYIKPADNKIIEV